VKKAEIIEELSRAEWLTKATKNIAKGNELARELYQFYFLTILQKPDEQIEKIYNDGYIQFWTIRLLYLCINGNRHPFGESRIYDQYDVYDLHLSEEPDLLLEREEDEQIEQKRINKINQVTEEAYFYERELFKLWCSGMSARAIHRQTDISVREILRVVKLMKERCTTK
jgi:hypothetical protein